MGKPGLTPAAAEGHDPVDERRAVGVSAAPDPWRTQVEELRAMPAPLRADAVIDMLASGGLGHDDWAAIRAEWLLFQPRAA